MYNQQRPRFPHLFPDKSRVLWSYAAEECPEVLQGRLTAKLFLINLEL
jgi:hypothetical protein